MKIFVDGHLNGLNNKTAMSGFSRLFFNGKKINIQYKKDYLTNSEAELIAIIHGVFYSQEGDEIYTDSQFVEGVVNKNWKTKEVRLSNLVVVVKSLLKIKKVKLFWVKRENNPAT